MYLLVSEVVQIQFVNLFIEKQLKISKIKEHRIYHLFTIIVYVIKGNSHVNFVPQTL